MNAASSDYRAIPPNVAESDVDYCRRLDALGHEEMWIRKALRYHFARTDLTGLGAFFNSFEQALLRHISLLDELEPNRSRYSLTRKVAGNLGLSDALAEVRVDRFYETGRLPYVR